MEREGERARGSLRLCEAGISYNVESAIVRRNKGQQERRMNAKQRQEASWGTREEERGKWGIYCQQRSFRKCQFRFYGIKCLGSLCGLLSQSGFQVLSSSLPLTLVSFCIMRRQQQFRLLCQRFLNVIFRLHQYNLIYREMKCQSFLF